METRVDEETTVFIDGVECIHHVNYIVHSNGTKEEAWTWTSPKECLEKPQGMIEAQQDNHITSEDFDLSEVLATIYEAIIEKE